MISLKLQFPLLLLLASSQILTAAPADPAAGEPPLFQAPTTLTFGDLVTLTTSDPPPGALEDKLQKLLKTPFISNEARGRGATPKIPRIPQLGPVLRVAEWNINRGENEAEVELALTDSKSFLAEAAKNPSMQKGDLSHAAEELEELHGADVVILDEVDDGVKRTKYHDVARDLAGALNMNYVYAVEFIELNRIYLGVKKMDQVDRHNDRESEVFGLDPKRYLGLEGSAVLSRYPIRDARIIRLPELYDWYHQEIKAVSDVEKARRWTSEELFQERIVRQVRRGGRMAVVVDLEVPQSPTGVVTVICPHLEDYTNPKGRRQQLNLLLSEMHSIANPVILAGDFNTTGKSARPITIRREILKYVTDYRFWARQVLFFVVPVPGLGYAFRLADYFKNHHDPTAFNVPLILGNRSRKLFDDLRMFSFADGGSFDFSGQRRESYRHRGSTLADSNQRAWKGFTPTFSFQRTFKGLIGRYKIDWFFVKEPSAPMTAGRTNFSPHLGRTLQLVNDALEPRISDHCPITVSLPLKSSEQKLIDTVSHASSNKP